MKHLLAALAVGAVVSSGLYGILNAVAHPKSEPEDPWLMAWSAAGLQCQSGMDSDEPQKHLMFGDGRELLKGRAFEHTLLRRYVIDNVIVQVVVLPRPDLAGDLPEGRHAGFRLKPKGSSVHLFRSGRNLLLVKTHTNGYGVFDEPTPKPLLDTLFDAFEKTAADFP